MAHIKKLASRLAFQADRKILTLEEENYYRLDLSAHEKIQNPWVSENEYEEIQPELENESEELTNFSEAMVLPSLKFRTFQLPNLK